MLSAIIYVGCPILFVLGAMSDLITYRIPNYISLALVGLFVVAVALSPMTLGMAGLHVLVGIGALLFGMALFGFNLIGGGDAKLFAAAALWMGPHFVLLYGLYFAIVGGVFAVLILALRAGPVLAAVAHVPGISLLLRPKAGMPYGVALGIGALIVLHSPTYLAIWL